MKRILPALCIVALAMFLSCSKNNLTSGGPGGQPAETTAEFHFADTGDMCSRILLHGSYYAGAPMTQSNYVTIKINVTKPGAIFYTTDNINGYYFASSDTIDSTGAHELVLRGYGMPLAVGNNKFGFSDAGKSLFQDIPILQQAVPLEAVPEAIYAKGRVNGSNFDLTFSGDENDVSSAWTNSGVAEVRSFIHSGVPQGQPGFGELIVQRQFFKGADTSGEAHFKQFFAPAAYPLVYNDNCGNQSDGVLVSWTDDQNNTYTSRPGGDQGESSYMIVGVDDGHRLDGKYYVRVKARLTANLYKSEIEVKRFENVEIVSCYIFR